jgi:uncharacterized protein (DUF2147 family)
LFKFLLGFTLLVFSTFAVSVDAPEPSIDGEWRHASKPAIILFNTDKGDASILLHEGADSEGLNLIRNIQRLDAKTWTGEMFDGYQDTYVKVTIILSEAKTLLINTENDEQVLKLVR